jgi:hypothetical protein
MIDDAQDVREVFDRIVRSGPPAPSSALALTAGRRARRRRTLAAAVGVAAALVAVGAVVAALPRPAPGPPATPPAPSASVRLAPQAPLTAERAGLVLPGCARSAGLDPDGLFLVNAFGAGDGGGALITGVSSYLYCDYMTASGPYAVTTLDRRGEPEPIAIDLAESRPGPGGDPGDPLAGGYDVVLGRVVPSARRVEVRIDEGAFPVTVYNGTFLIRWTWDPGRSAVGHRAVTVRAYDGLDRLLGQATART